MEWREIPILPGYLVSEFGDIKGPNGDIIETRENGNGYKVLMIRLPVHQAVLYAFEGPPPETKSISRHLDGNRTNNSRHNLKWGTYKENTADAIKHGTHASLLPNFRVPSHGISQKQSKLSEDQVREIKLRAKSKTELIKDIALDYPVSYGTVCKIARGQDWKHITV